MRIFFLSLFISSIAFGQAGTVTSHLRLIPHSLPSACSTGDLRFDSGSDLINYCQPANTWNPSTGNPTNPLVIANGGTSTTTQYNPGITYFDGTKITSGSDLVWVQNTGNMGIGTNNPQDSIDSGGARFHDASSGVRITNSGGIAYIEVAGANMSGSGDLHFSDMLDSHDWMTIKGTTGRVGIGTTSPGYLLDVNGTSDFSGLITAKAGIALMGSSTNGVEYYNGTSTVTTSVGTSGYVLTSNGSGHAPSFQAAGSNSFKAPTIQTFVSSTGTYTTPTSPGPLYIRVVMVGAGGGGAGTTNGGGNGANSTFGTTLLTANGGTGGVNSAIGGAGGSASLGSGPIGIAMPGGYGGAAHTQTVGGVGGNGGSSALGGAGGGGVYNGNGAAGATNSGSGGGGAGGTVSTNPGSGGGSGGYVDAIITTPSSTYSYSVGAAGSASGDGGAAGGSGGINVFEFYQ